MYVMETIFDHNMTEEEKFKFLGKKIDKNFIQRLSVDGSNLLIAELYLIRNDKDMMMKYVNKLSPNMKRDFMYRFSNLE